MAKGDSRCMNISNRWMIDWIDTWNRQSVRHEWIDFDVELRCALWGSASLLGVLTVPAAPWEYESTSQTMKRSDVEMQRIGEVIHGMTIMTWWHKKMNWELQSLAVLSEAGRNLGLHNQFFLALKALGIARDDKRDPRHRRTTALPITGIYHIPDLIYVFALFCLQ